jgi:hypothetical protein
MSILVDEGFMPYTLLPKSKKTVFARLIKAPKAILPAPGPESLVELLMIPNLDSIAVLNPIEEHAKVESAVVIIEQPVAMRLALFELSEIEFNGGTFLETNMDALLQFVLLKNAEEVVKTGVGEEALPLLATLREATTIYLLGEEATLAVKLSVVKVALITETSRVGL